MNENDRPLAPWWLSLFFGPLFLASGLAQIFDYRGSRTGLVTIFVGWRQGRRRRIFGRGNSYEQDLRYETRVRIGIGAVCAIGGLVALVIGVVRLVS
jgi:hypothetical protein